MRWVFRWIVRGSGETRILDVYDIAFLAGGARRVVDAAVIALNRRGLLVVHASQVRTVAVEEPLHAVERAVAAFCGRTRSIDAVRAGLQRSPEVEAIGRGLATWGLVAGADRQVTRAGRRHLQQAECDPSMPAYVFVESSALGEAPVRRPTDRAQPVQPGRGPTPGRGGRSRTPRRRFPRFDVDSDPGSGTGSHSGGGHSCGGGGGGGGGGE
ncbi:TIGR04222 domain-containing membrane protein [Streptomyces sp. NPDC057939]|uniref:TIGR04222 domain-containing membrane protein n=1 Tax=Streptomyces sp. NPDC057939 TaxID=3346284 RepID=UPI0036E07E72